jgi:hypothetical protein
MTIPKRTEEVLEENNKKVIYLANTGQMKYKTGGTFQGLLVEAMSGPERIGYLTAEKRHDGNYVLDGVFVEESYRNNGIATDMLRKAQNSVQMTPYITTDNQVYQSEAGKRLAEKEYRMMTASTFVTAGPLLAVPEIIGAGEAAVGAAGAAAGAGEAAASGGGALSGLGGQALKSLGIHSLLNGLKGPGANSQQQPTSQSSGSGGEIQTPDAAHPDFTASSKISTTVAWPEGTHVMPWENNNMTGMPTSKQFNSKHKHKVVQPGVSLTRKFVKNLAEAEAVTAPADEIPIVDGVDVLEAAGKTIIQNPLQTKELIQGIGERIKALRPETPTIEPMHMPETEPMTLPGHRPRRPKSIHIEQPTVEPVEPATSIEAQPEMPTSSEGADVAKPNEPSMSTSEQPKPNGLKGFSLPSWGGKLVLNVPHTTIQSYDPARPRFSSANDTRLLNLIGDLYYAKKNEWSPEDETVEEKVEDHDEWAGITNHGEYRMPGKKKPLPPTTWE